MRLKYSDTTKTGIPWADPVPSHWQEAKFKFLLNEKKKTQNLSLSAGSISFGTVVEKDSEKLMEETLAAYQELLAGEFIINPLNLNFDLKSLRTALSDKDVVVSSGYIIAKPTGVANTDYLRWLLHEFDVSHMKTLGAGIRQTINFGDIANSKAMLPTDAEQESIASFLNTETQRIDSLISEKQRFIDLLKEKRQALISHVVTKGLDANVEMKDSGVEWIGSIPKDWEVKPLYLLGFENKSKNSGMKNDNLLTLSYGNIKRKSIDTLGGLLPESFETYQILEKGMIVFRMTDLQNDKRSLRSAMANERGIITSAYIGFMPTKISSEYLNFLMRAYDVVKAFYNLGSGLRQSLRFEELKRIPIVIPPVSEQIAIAYHIEDMTKRTDKLITETELSIELLREHRSALISAAVTGKIDVRGFDNNKNNKEES